MAKAAEPRPLVRWQPLRQLACALSLAGLVTVPAYSQSLPQSPAKPSATVAEAAVAAPVENSQLSAELFFNIVVGELSLINKDPGAAFALILNSAKKSKDEVLFQRAVSIALESRSGESALTAARAWRVALPDSIPAARYVVQILMALNRNDQLPKALSDYLTLSFAGTSVNSTAPNTGDASRRDDALTAIANIFSRATDKVAAAKIVEQALAPYLSVPATAFPAWIALARMRLASDNSTGALEATRQAQALQASAPEPALLALALMASKTPLAEPLIKTYLDNPASPPKPEIRLLYTRTLLANARFAEAMTQALKLSTEAPSFASGWLVLGSLQFQDSQDRNDMKATAAQASLKKFIQLAEPLPREQSGPSLSRAYVLLAQIAENNKDFSAAKDWLGKIDNPEDAFALQNRRASLLAKQGKLDEALTLLNDLPETSAEAVSQKLSAQVQLLRDAKQYQRAYDLLSKAIASQTAAAASESRQTDLSDLYYDQAMVAEKLNRLDDMERLLRLVMATKPDHHHAYNALGYSLAERQLRLPEAKMLIQKAVQLSPDDPFIADSLGWVEFRLGNVGEAERILTAAFKARPDAEIAAHLGEVLWSQGRKAEATALWKTGMTLNPSNDTLIETLKRLGVKL